MKCAELSQPLWQKPSICQNKIFYVFRQSCSIILKISYFIKRFPGKLELACRNHSVYMGSQIRRKESGCLMKSWKKGAVIGGIWGLLSIVPYSYISSFDGPDKKILLTLIGFPAFIALSAGFHFLYVFIGSPLIGIIIGTSIGYLLEKRCAK